MSPYSLQSRCVSEALATFTFVFFLLTLLANKLLPKTKGHDLSYGWLAFGVGLAVFVPVQFLGHISSALNPAMTLGAAIAGQIDIFDWPALAASQMIGAFFAAVTMYLYYYPRFRTEPEPPPKRDAERLLRTRDDIGRRGLDYVSYNTREPVITPRLPSQLRQLRERLATPSRRASNVQDIVRKTPNGTVVYHTSDVLGADAVTGRERRRRSVMVGALHRRLDQLEAGEISLGQTRAKSMTEKNDAFETIQDDIYVRMISRTEKGDSDLDSIPEHTPSVTSRGLSNAQFSDMLPAQSFDDEAFEAAFTENEETEIDPLLNASRVADRNMKLAVFCTRPTTYLVPINLLTEIISTFFLVIGILLIKERSAFMYEGYNDVYRNGIMSLYIGLLISLLVLSLGGMGVAMNPARDLAPRLAHWILPIDGKGVSEWYYAWIPVVGPLVGGSIAGVVYLGIVELNKTTKEGGLYDAEFSNITQAVSTLLET